MNFGKLCNPELIECSRPLTSKRLTLVPPDAERVRLLISEVSLKPQLQSISEDSREVDDFKYRLDGAVAKERSPETIIKSL